MIGSSIHRARGGWLAIAAAAVLIAGCGGGGQASSVKDSLELQIQKQLPSQAEKALGTAVTVPSVACTELTETTFNCLATLRSYDLHGRLVNDNVPIDGSCDDESCIWSVKGF